MAESLEWKHGQDIQVVLDFFAVITYVTDYYAKDDTGSMEIIKAALAQSESKDIKERMKITRLITMRSQPNCF